MSILSKFGIGASIVDFGVKKLFRDLIKTDSVIALGSTIADATQLTSGRNTVTAADDAVGVKLPHAKAYMTVEIVNTVSNKTLLVYPFSTSEQINAITAGDAFSLVGGARGQFYCDADLHWYVAAANLTGTSTSATTAELNAAYGVTLGTSAPSKNLTTDAAESLVWATTDATASETVTLSIQDTRTGAGAVGWTHKAELVSNVALGSYSNALYGLVTFGSSGSVTGLTAGVCGEVELSAGTTSGTYASLEAELTANAAVSTGTDTAFLYANIAGSNGTGKTTVNTNAHLMVLGTGVVDTSSGLWDAIGAQAVTASGRLRIKIGATLYYIPVCASAALTS